MMGAGKAHHFGGSLSAADIITALYFYKMRYNPADPKWPDRDRFVMSKGHSVPAQYAALAMLGVSPLEELATLKCLGSRLQGHPAMHVTPGIEACTGALGEGLSFANGMALAARLAEKSYRVYCLLGDGELHEGQVWEAAMTSVKHCLNNLVAIIDRNRLKAMDATECGKLLNPLAQRWASFGWAVKEVDGHDMAALCDALEWADGQVSQPSMIIANTVKGKGVSFMAGQAGFHNASLTEEQYRQAVAELDLALKEQTQ
jgi:transketolase